MAHTAVPCERALALRVDAARIPSVHRERLRSLRAVCITGKRLPESPLEKELKRRRKAEDEVEKQKKVMEAMAAAHIKELEAMAAARIKELEARNAYLEELEAKVARIESASPGGGTGAGAGTSAGAGAGPGGAGNAAQAAAEVQQGGEGEE
ncbi:hypothetical protein HYH03_014495 [Edaphochlamys debaryana]|uniref:Uncharacterized protein n=1 Tax=Edaphochlamys debaryana TaxID=47281 RepID=A0A835XL46_9CHLO|nr:hypothetical protein HYH03_014495 [Edaphochlamys debaryana]|eukprot:KAG2486812.1 hypothetical protein HYH03_014495 [Edaphochlamys debaryana]